MNQIVAPTVDERGEERHPAWVLIGASRVSSTPGAVLFDSDILHQHYVVVRISRAARERNLSQDWKRSRQRILEISMSDAQWASFVSSMNVGEGVPATLTWDSTLKEPDVPGMPFEPRLAVSMAEVHQAAQIAQREVEEAFEVYRAKPTKDNLRMLEARISNMTPNIDFAAKSLGEHAENVVQRARADIESFVVQKAEQLGLEPGDIGGLPALTQGEEDS